MLHTSRAGSRGGGFLRIVCQKIGATVPATSLFVKPLLTYQSPSSVTLLCVFWLYLCVGLHVLAVDPPVLQHSSTVLPSAKHVRSLVS